LPIRERTEVGQVCFAKQFSKGTVYSIRSPEGGGNGYNPDDNEVRYFQSTTLHYISMLIKFYFIAYTMLGLTAITDLTPQVTPPAPSVLPTTKILTTPPTNLVSNRGV
jgi:hypothetical protein